MYQRITVCANLFCSDLEGQAKDFLEAPPEDLVAEMLAEERVPGERPAGVPAPHELRPVHRQMEIFPGSSTSEVTTQPITEDRAEGNTAMANNDQLQRVTERLNADQAPTGRGPFVVAPGVTLDGRYLIEKELGHGGIGIVYLARDQKLHGVPVVVKALLDNVLEPEHKAYFEKKFKQEIEALARIDHPGVVRALDFGELADGRSYLVMQYVSGVSLRSVMQPQGMELDRISKLIHQMGRALTAAHEQGVVHRDLKPENIMLQQVGDEEYVKLIDFGIATVLETPSPPNIKTTKVVGTIDYMAPEQLYGKPAAASDIYALGVIAYEMVTGRRPFNPASPYQLVELQRAGVRVKPCDLRPDLPETAQAVILKALAYAQQYRHARAKDFGDALAQTLTVEVLESPSARLELGHVLFTDLVGYSKLMLDEQSRLLQKLQETVSRTVEFQQALAHNQLIRLPTGDGMALVFFGDPVAPVQCALEIAQALKNSPELKLRMGIHTGPVRRIADINHNVNVSGGGINMAQRVMDCGDAGHILLSKTVADVLSQLSEWAEHLQDWGEQEVKHGVKVHIFNLYTGEVGNPDLPEKIRVKPTPPQPTTHPPLLWLIISTLFLALTCGLAAVISRRFLGDAPDVTSVLITLALGLWCLLVGSIFTRSGQQWVERGFSRLGIRLKFQGTWRTAFMLTMLLIVCAFYFSLPAIARIYNERAVQFYQARDLPAAIKSYARAISLDPDYAVAHYNLASAYEDVLEFDQALAKYQTALRADPKFYFAYNNLARLYLVHRKDYASALNILNAALELKPPEPHVRYTLYKNRGWANFGLGFYDLAAEDLREAIKWREDGAAAHCLLAQALEAEKKEETARQEWERCVADAPGEADVEASWLSLAQERLRQGGKK